MAKAAPWAPVRAIMPSSPPRGPMRRASTLFVAVAFLVPALALSGCVADQGEADDPMPGMDHGSMTQEPTSSTTMPGMDHGSMGDPGTFTALDRSTAGLPEAMPSETIPLANGSAYTLRASPVTRDLGDGPIRMFAYNGMLPGPTLLMDQGARVTIRLENALPIATTIHWHGLRLGAAFDGVPGVSQRAVEPGGSFEYTVDAPDEGVYWYHPHARDDIQQELGLYGAIVVKPADEAATPAPREVVVMLDDILLDEGDVAPMRMEEADHALTGRYGNVFLANLDPAWATSAAPGERVRLLLVTATLARPLNISFPGAERVELIGLDAGYLRAPRALESIQLSPGERAIVDLVMPSSGGATLLHTTPASTRELGTIRVDASTTPAFAGPAPAAPHARAAAELDAVARREASPLVEWELDIRMNMDGMGMGGMAMRPEDVEPIEWDADPMDPMNAQATPSMVTWIIRDEGTGKENLDAMRTFAKGSLVPFRITNLAESEHPMQHPIHFHGQRFLVRSIDGEPPQDSAWKDVVLVPAGSTVDILVDMSNPGTWVAHCHILEHAEAGMVTAFQVT